MPDCKTERGCAIPPLGYAEARTLYLRERLIKLSNILSPECVLKIYGATIEDVDMLALIEEEFKIKEEENHNRT